MPIRLDKLDNKSNIPTYTPKFFSPELTGSGKITGRLNENLNPSKYDFSNVKSYNSLYSPIKKSRTNNDHKVVVVPFDVLTAHSLEYMRELNIPNKNQMCLFAEETNGADTVKHYLQMIPQSIMIDETKTTDTAANGAKKTATKREITVLYHLFWYAVINDRFNEKAENYGKIENIANRMYRLGASNISRFCHQYTVEPLKFINSILDSAQRCGCKVKTQDVDDYIANYNLHSEICEQVKHWTEDCATIIDEFLTDIGKRYSTETELNKKVIMDSAIKPVIAHLDDNKIPLELYKDIYASIMKNFPNEGEDICKQNLNLLLNNTLDELNKKRNSLAAIPAMAKDCKGFSRYSKEQQNAIRSTDPLTLVQAAAGTGKSTVILGRIDELVANGVDPDEITVLSFTNAAADNIKDRNPNLHSMTIASMIHEIYSLNYPTHNLSTIDLLTARMKTLFRNDAVANTFRKHLISVKKNEVNSVVELSNFIEENFDKIIEILDTTKETTLELEIIIAYQGIDTLKEPNTINAKYLIVDEVQDNSIFEFIYTLKYINKHNSSLFIVGDCSQTLYEFRAANPRALNVLEGSGIFSTFRLQVNYRSNQEILDFANVVLREIEANKYANLQLQANSLRKVTAKSFQEKVQLHYESMPKMGLFRDELPNFVQMYMKPYIDKKLKAGQKVAFLAYSRNEIYAIEKKLKDMYPSKQILNLIPERINSTTVFADFISMYWDQIKFTGNGNVVGSITRLMIDNLMNIVGSRNYDKMLPKTQQMLTDWAQRERQHINDWQTMYLNNQISLQEFMDNTRDTLYEFEVQMNNVKQTLVTAKNQANKDKQLAQNADFIVSTIHSAKGLEFDNVIIVYKNDSDMDEDKKRMYYVAFTRAMKSEFIFAYDTVKKGKIKIDYDTIVDTLNGHTGINVTVNGNDSSGSGSNAS